jgi:hypothetical protein
MTVLTPGHRYVLDNFEHPDDEGQIIQFIEKEPSKEDSTKFVTVNDGTTNEDVLRMLIDRLSFQYDKFPSRETFNAIKNLRDALDSLEERTRNRQKRGVEGKNLK